MVWVCNGIDLKGVTLQLTFENLCDPATPELMNNFPLLQGREFERTEFLMDGISKNSTIRTFDAKMNEGLNERKFECSSYNR